VKLTVHTPPYTNFKIYIYIHIKILQFPQYFPGRISRLKTTDYLKTSEINAYVIQEMN